MSFLNSGNLLHTIFPRSQCWCLDGESKFALRIRPDSYYRIELPYETDEDREQARQFKAVLNHVLQFEKTPCPFARSFQVPLPDRPKTPPRTRPKRPPEKAKKWLFDKTWMPEDGTRPSAAISLLEPTRKIQSLRSVTTPLVPRPASPTPTPSQQTRLDTPPAPSPLDGEAVTKAPMEPLSLVSSAESFETARQSSPSPQYLDAEAELINPWAVEPKSQLGDRKSTRLNSSHWE